MINFTQGYTLENQRVSLRPLQENDLENLIHFSLNEPELWKFSLIKANNYDNLKNYINLAIRNQAEKKELPFIIYDKKYKEYAGVTRIYAIQKENKNLKIGYTWYGKKYQKTGLNQNCKYLLLEFIFEKLLFERVEFNADSDNIKSINSMKNLGCYFEGTLRNNYIKPNGKFRDSVVLSILKKEWLDSVKNNLIEKISR